MQKTYNRKQEQICVIYCPSCKGAVAACKERSKTFQGIADAMAIQWGEFLQTQCNAQR